MMYDILAKVNDDNRWNNWSNKTIIIPIQH